MEINEEQVTNEALKAAVTADLAKLKQLYQQYGKGPLNRLSLKYGKTPLHLASINGHLEVVKYLINIGCDLETSTQRSQSAALVCAVEKNQSAVVDYLLSKRANQNVIAHSTSGPIPLLEYVKREKSNLLPIFKKYEVFEQDLLLECNGLKHKVHVRATSIEELKSQVFEQVNIAKESKLLYFDDLAQDFVVVTKLDQITKVNGIRLQVIPVTIIKRAKWLLPEEVVCAGKWEEVKGAKGAKFRRLLVKDGDKILEHNAFNLCTNLLKLMNTGNINVHQVYAIQNEGLESSFNIHYQNVCNRWHSSPHLFKKSDWKNNDGAQREGVLCQYLSFSNKFAWNAADQITITSSVHAPIVPMFQGTNDKAVWEICKAGFATVATLDDGWYGQGIYFTSYGDYARTYTSASGGYIIVALTIPGNVYPVVERANTNAPECLSGKPCKKGYQSHFVMVQGPNGDLGHVCAQNYQGTKYDELVVFADAQALPLFVLKLA